MAPILQTPRALAVRILLGLALLRQMPLAVGHHLAHVVDVVLVICLGVLVRVLLEDFDNLSPASSHENPIVSGLLFVAVSCFVLILTSRGRPSLRSRPPCSSPRPRTTLP